MTRAPAPVATSAGGDGAGGSGATAGGACSRRPQALRRSGAQALRRSGAQATRVSWWLTGWVMNSCPNGSVQVAHPAGVHHHRPPRRVLHPVMTPAQRQQVGGVGRPGRPGNDVVQVAEPRRPRASRGPAVPVAVPHEPAHRRRWRVPLGAGLDRGPATSSSSTRRIRVSKARADPGHDVPGDHPDAGNLRADRADLPPGRALVRAPPPHRVRISSAGALHGQRSPPASSGAPWWTPAPGPGPGPPAHRPAPGPWTGPGPPAATRTAWSSTAALHSADSCAGSTATHSLSPTTCEGHTRTDRSSRALAARSRTASASTSASARRVRARTCPPVSPQTRGKITASTCAHPAAVVSAVSATMIEARHPSRLPAAIAANVPGSRDTNAAAVCTRSCAPERSTPASERPSPTRTHSTCPAPRSTPPTPHRGPAPHRGRRSRPAPPPAPPTPH